MLFRWGSFLGDLFPFKRGRFLNHISPNKSTHFTRAVGNVLFVAGTPVAFPKDDLARAYEGRMGGVLWVASAATGEKLAEIKLDTPPAWDSMAVADGMLYISLTDGRVMCMTGE